MGFSFEVKDSDLLGRIGELKVGGKSLETPCLFPVIHPVNQAVSTAELGAIGYKGLMTNAYILHKRRKDEALRKGIHRLLDFDGVFMSDSGGYQVLEYGEVDIDYKQVAAFQSEIGSDFGVTLDRPTGYSESRKYAEATVDYSLKNALATMKEFGGSGTTWVGPVQGGLFGDLLRRSARALTKGGFEFLALGSPVQIMENYRFADLVKMIVNARKAMPFSAPLHLFGAGHPLTMALSVALGCDTFDSASYILFAREGRYMTERGASRLKEMKYLPCSCPVCSRSSVSGFLELEALDRTRALAIHNLHVLKKEVESCKEAITEGRLWDLVRERASSHPRLFEAFVEMTRQGKLLADGTSPMKEKGLLVSTSQDLARPELAQATLRLNGSIPKGRGVALLLVSDASIPIARMRFEKKARPRGSFDVFRLHPLFGVYPAELDFVYPFTQTVMAQEENAERFVELGVKSLKARGYSRVLLARVGKDGAVARAGPTSRLKRKGASPSPRRPSSRPRLPRLP